MPYDYPVRNMIGNKVKLTQAKKQRLDEAWDGYNNAFRDFALSRTRSNYNALAAAGKKLVETQAALGVWVKHPVNCTPGLKPNDPRIIEDCDGCLTAS